MSIVYETGATSHAVNELVLFTDTTKKVAEYRDKTFHKIMGGVDKTLALQLLLEIAQKEYMKEIPDFFDHQHIAPPRIKHGIHRGEFTAEQMAEYRQLYMEAYEEWKKENYPDHKIS